MSADVLRRAASLMRERAEAATPGPWETNGRGLITHVNGHSERVYVTECYTDAPGELDAEHIASWHPAVALAVADWLEDAAETVELGPALSFDMRVHIATKKALTVARAYLGGSS